MVALAVAVPGVAVDEVCVGSVVVLAVAVAAGSVVGVAADVAPDVVAPLEALLAVNCACKEAKRFFSNASNAWAIWSLVAVPAALSELAEAQEASVAAVALVAVVATGVSVCRNVLAAAFALDDVAELAHCPPEPSLRVPRHA